MYTTYPGPVPCSPDYMKQLFGIEGYQPHKKLEISFENQWFTITDGVMFNCDRTELIWCDRWKKGSYVVPSTVTRIGKRKFLRYRLG